MTHPIPHPDDVEGWIATLRSTEGPELESAVNRVINLKHHLRPNVTAALAEVYRRSPDLSISLPEIFAPGDVFVPDEVCERFIHLVLSDGTGPNFSAERYLKYVDYAFLLADKKLGALAEPVLRVVRGFVDDASSRLTRELLMVCTRIAFAIPREDGIAYLRELSEHSNPDLATAASETLPYFFEED